MGEPLDDFNRRMTLGDTLGPPTNAAESAAQAFLDARKPGGEPSAGGGIEWSVKRSLIVFVIATVFFYLGVHLTENHQGGLGMTGILLAITAGFLMLFGVAGLIVCGAKGALEGGVRRWQAWLPWGLSAVLAWYLAPNILMALWRAGLALPLSSRWVIALAVFALSGWAMQSVLARFRRRG